MLLLMPVLVWLGVDIAVAEIVHCETLTHSSQTLWKVERISSTVEAATIKIVKLICVKTKWSTATANYEGNTATQHNKTTEKM